MAPPFLLRDNGIAIHTPLNGMERWPWHHHSSLRDNGVAIHTPLDGTPSQVLLRDNGFANQTPSDGMEKWPCHRQASLDILDCPSIPFRWRWDGEVAMPSPFLLGDNGAAFHTPLYGMEKLPCPFSWDPFAIPP